MDWPERLLTLAVRRMPAQRGDWGAAMLAEFAQLRDPFTRWRFALGCVRDGQTTIDAMFERPCMD